MPARVAAARLRSVRVTRHSRASWIRRRCGAQATTRPSPSESSTPARLVVERAGVEPGMDVLDVACGTGNATIPAAKAGARVTGLDFAPGAARDRARARGRRDGRDRLRRGRRPGAAVRRRELRPRGLHVRPHVRPRPRAHGRRDEAGAAARRARSRSPAGRRRARSGGCSARSPSSCRRRPAAQPPLLWGTEDHVRELLGRRRVRAARDRVDGRVGRVLRALHARQLRPAAERARGARRARGRARRGPTRDSSTARTRPTTARSASAASICVSVVRAR